MQENDVVSDYRKWLAFNNALTDPQHVNDLCQAVKNKCSTASYRIELSSSEKGNCLSVTGSGYDTLEIHESEIPGFLNYINKHYAFAPANQAATSVNTIASTIPKGASPILNTHAISHKANFFLNENIVLHAIGYAIIGLLIGQALVVPQLLNIKFPNYGKWIFIVLFAMLGHLAVKSYKKNFLTNRLRYGVVAKITITIFGLVSAGFSFEIMLFNLFSAVENPNLIAVSMVGVAMVIGGLFIGWVASLFIYFLNGGKILTKPTS
jgi:hypothetical protein